MPLNSITPSINRNPYTDSNATYDGYVYAFYGSGGFTMDQCFNTILLHIESPLIQYDVTQAVQVRFDVRTFNQKISLFKGDNNQYILDSSFNSYTDSFPVDSITISADEFVTGMTAAQVISVGTYSSMYSDYVQFVNTYFGYAGGFSSLFAAASEFDINHGVFDANSLINLLNPYTDPSGELVKPVLGSITISNINNLLRYAVDSNVFNNRTPASASTVDNNTIVTPGTGIASDLCGNVTSDLQELYQSNYGMADGFIAGDLIYIPAGTTIKLHLDIESEVLGPLNNIGATNVLDLIHNQDFNSKYNSPYYSESSSASTTNIDRILTAPLLIKLDNLSTTTSQTYNQLFLDETGLPINQYMNAPYRHYTGINGLTVLNDANQTTDISSNITPYTTSSANNNLSSASSNTN